jgi:hypothetical protein
LVACAYAYRSDTRTRKGKINFQSCGIELSAGKLPVIKPGGGAGAIPWPAWLPVKNQ